MATLRRSLPFLALALAAALVIAWQTTPTPEPRGSAKRSDLATPLIGTWSMTIEDPGLPRSPNLHDGQQDSDETLKRLLREAAPKDSFSFRITYRADRTGVIEPPGAGVDRKQKFSWSLLSASPEEIRIDQEMNDPPSLERITYRVESPDRLTIVTGAMKGSSLTRVK